MENMHAYKVEKLGFGFMHADDVQLGKARCIGKYRKDIGREIVYGEWVGIAEHP